jgi:hypothetical protein
LSSSATPSAAASLIGTASTTNRAVTWTDLIQRWSWNIRA